MPKTALVVDDSTCFRQMVSLTLKDAGFTILEGSNGQEALNVLGANKVDLVVTDLNMPVMDGVTLVKNLRAKPQMRTVPILILTTESQADMKAKGKAAGATGWLVKPFRPDQLLKVINEVVP